MRTNKPDKPPKPIVHDLTVKEFVRRYFDKDNGFDSATFEALLGNPLTKIITVIEHLSYAAGRILGAHNPPTWNSWRPVIDEPTTDDLERSIRWTICKLWFHRSSLAPMLELRSCAEQCFLRGNLEDAEVLVNELNSRFGVSLWSLATHFRISEASHGTQFNRTALLQFTVTVHAPVSDGAG